MKVIETTMHTIDLSGIDNHTVRNLAIVTAGAVVRTNLGEIIIILHQAADMTSDSRTILSAGQLESFGCTIHDKSPVITTGEPHIRPSDGCIIPISFRKGLLLIPHSGLVNPGTVSGIQTDKFLPELAFLGRQ
jgi:hypothetical protein